MAGPMARNDPSNQNCRPNIVMVAFYVPLRAIVLISGDDDFILDVNPPIEYAAIAAECRSDNVHTCTPLNQSYNRIHATMKKSSRACTHGCASLAIDDYK